MAVEGPYLWPVAPNADGEFLPERPKLLTDLAHARQLGANCLRVYHEPAPALWMRRWNRGCGFLLMCPWEKHRCFFEDWVLRCRMRVSACGGRPGRWRAPGPVRP